MAVRRVTGYRKAGKAVIPDSPYSILLVDDSRDYRNLVAHYLSSIPCEVTMAEDGEEALERYTENHYDLIIMDIIMPLMDGVDATAAIRKIEKENGRKETPILALSMEDGLETSVDCIKAGATRMVLKPVGRNALVHVIGEMLGKDLS